MSWVPKIEIQQIDGRWRVICYPGGGPSNGVFIANEEFAVRGEAEAFVSACEADPKAIRGRWVASLDGWSPALGGKTGYFNTWAVERVRYAALRPLAPYREIYRAPENLSIEIKGASAKGVFQEIGAKGGNAAAAVTRKVRDHAIGLAKERAPVDGWQSAPDARKAIMADVRDFARQLGRAYSERKVEEWLRGAGIKQGGRTQ